VREVERAARQARGARVARLHGNRVQTLSEREVARGGKSSARCRRRSISDVLLPSV
jgi:hypothetical protein